MQLRDQVSGGSETNGWIISRRIQDARGTILVWEGSACWQIGDDPNQRVTIEDGGWAFIAAQSQEMSIVRFGGCTQIHAIDDSSIDTRDSMVAGICRAKKRRCMQVEIVFMDLFLQEARQQLM